jgi:two-component system, LytTR family, sensor kinase
MTLHGELCSRAGDRRLIVAHGVSMSTYGGSETRPIGAGPGEARRQQRAARRPASAELGRRGMLLNFAFWTLFGTLQASNWLSWSDGDWTRSVWRVLASALFNAYLWALLTPTILRLASRANAAEQRTLVRRVAGAVGLGLVVAAVATVLAASAHRILLPRPIPDEPHIAGVRLSALGRWYFQEIVTYGVVLVAGLAGDVARRYRAREREAARLQAEAGRLQAEQAELRARAAQLQAQSAELQAQLAEARLAVLRTRLNPHFLFNTLNAVSALVAKDPRRVRDMIALLSELLRHALTDSREQEIPLREEVRLLRLYLEILEIRYQGQLETAVTVDPEVGEALVPNLILQPLVENAMKHGIDRAGGHGTIQVLAHRSGDELVLTVRDSGPGDDAVPPSASESRLGLRLTRERLAELYGDEQRLELKPTPGGGMSARVTLPYHTSEDVRLAEDLVSA